MFGGKKNIPGRKEGDNVSKINISDSLGLWVPEDMQLLLIWQISKTLGISTKNAAKTRGGGGSLYTYRK